MNQYFAGFDNISILVSSLNTTKIDRDPTYYRCPFPMFNGGRPASNQLGETMYCDMTGAHCPRYHFCSFGYPDGRSICCHILGKVVVQAVLKHFVVSIKWSELYQCFFMHLCTGRETVLFYWHKVKHILM